MKNKLYKLFDFLYLLFIIFMIIANQTHLKIALPVVVILIFVLTLLILLRIWLEPNKEKNSRIAHTVFF